ncbi:hypothetical protein N7490_005424 [Penicillium lividum]|nr:hypothetical protein N7490_005424 [Penicillium lividum]
MSIPLDAVVIHYDQQLGLTSSKTVPIFLADDPYFASTPIESAEKPLFLPEASYICEYDLQTRHRRRPKNNNKVVWRDNPLGDFAVKKHLLWQGEYSLSHGFINGMR